MLRRSMSLCLSVLAVLSLALLAGCQESNEKLASSSPDSKLVEIRIKKHESGSDKGKKFAEPPEPTARKNGTNPSDRVQWTNNSGDRVVLYFVKKWPFSDTRDSIRIEAGTSSPEFTISDSADSGKHVYEIHPPTAPPSDSKKPLDGTPGDPAVLVGG